MALKVQANKTTQKSQKKILIVGLPNSGKSSIFNNLTGEYTLVANYPHTTVKEDRKLCRIDGQLCEIIDTPGLHCLYIHSEEELVVRDLLFWEKPDVIVQCIDANHLKQSLVLTVDLLELGIPMVAALNAVDETGRKGIWIDSVGLSHSLGIEVVEGIAITGKGTAELKRAIKKASLPRKKVTYGDIIENNLITIEKKMPENENFKHKVSVLMLQQDPYVENYLEKKHGSRALSQVKKEMDAISRKFRGNINIAINNKRNQWISSICEKTIRKSKITQGELPRFFGNLCRHPIYGIPILLIILVVTYLFIVYGARFIEKFINIIISSPLIEFVSNSVSSPFWQDFLIGHYGILTLGLLNAICTVLPILAVFFTIFSILEDSGYIPNLCVLTKRIVEKIGLTGKAILPLILAFGCKTMATLVTKGLKNRKEKFIAVFLIGFAIPCSAQLGISIGILGRIGFSAFLIAFGAMGITALAAGLLLNKFIKEESVSHFMQELPAMRVPSIKGVFIKIYFRLYWFLKEALPIFLIAALVMFFFDKFGILEFLKAVLNPLVVNWFGLPLDMVDALIICLARHEAAAGLLLQMVDKGMLNSVQSIVGVVIISTFIPCFANIMAMVKEIGLKWAIIVTIAICFTSFVMAGILNWFLIFTIGRFII